MKQRLVERLRWERDRRVSHALYYWTQIFMSYNSNHMEGSTLSAEQTAQIYETGRFLADRRGEQISIDDAIETANHFTAFNYILDHADEAVDERMVCELHGILKRGTSDSTSAAANVGGYKTRDNEIVQRLGVTAAATAPADRVPELMREVFDAYSHLDDDPLRIAMCHWMFEKVHPFSDGNGRVGRLVMFKECLRLDTVPPLIRDGHRNMYVNGLDMFPGEPGWLTDLICSERDAYQTGFIENMAAGQVSYSYNGSWRPDGYAAELQEARSFGDRIAGLAEAGAPRRMDPFDAYGGGMPSPGPDESARAGDAGRDAGL